MIPSMTASHPHWLRSAIIAGIGLLIAIISIVWIGVAIRSAGPETLSLSYRIDAKRTIAFARGKTEEDLRTATKRLASVFGETNIPDLSSLPKGTGYEVALIADDEDKREWIVETHLKNQQETLIASTEGRSLLLPLSSIKQSLGASPFFRNREKNATGNMTYAMLEHIPALSASGSGLLRAMQTPFRSVLMLQKNASAQEWMFEKKETSLFTANASLPAFRASENHPFFALSASNPSALFGRLHETLAVQNPSLLEGIEGIAKERLERVVRNTDLEGALDDLMKKGGSIEIRSDGFLLQGIAADLPSLRTWIDAMRSAATPALIRSQTFLHGDRRTDVIAAPEHAPSRIIGGWDMLSIGSGSSMRLTVATKGTTMLFSNKEAMLQAALESPASKETERGLFAGETNAGWLLSVFPYAAFLKPIIGDDAFSVRFHATDERDAISIRFQGK